MSLSDSAAFLARKYEMIDPDVRLMLQVQNDNAAAFEELVSRYQSRLVGVMEHLVPKRELAEDLAQEVFMRVFRARKTTFPVPNSPRGCSRLPTMWPATRNDRFPSGRKSR